MGRRGETGEAERHLARAAEIDPDDLPTRVLWARVLAQQGQSKQAIEELERVLSIDPATPGARLALVAIETEHARGARPRRRLRAGGSKSSAGWSSSHPRIQRAHLGQGMALILDGSYGPARAALEASLERLPDHAALGDLLARLLATCPDAAVRDGARAVVLAERVVEIEPSLDHSETLAMALAEAGRWEEAVASQRRVLAEEKASIGSTSERRGQSARALRATRAGARPLARPALDRPRLGSRSDRLHVGLQIFVPDHVRGAAIELEDGGVDGAVDDELFDDDVAGHRVPIFGPGAADLESRAGS